MARMLISAASIMAGGLVLLAGAPAARGQVTCPGADPIVLDCNGNSTDDFCDIAGGTTADANTNGIPDECDSAQCYAPWSGIEPVPPFSPGAFLHGLDTDGDGLAWDNPTGSWTVSFSGCPASQGKAIKGVAQVPPTADFITSEHFRSVQGRLDCGAAIYRLTFDARYEAALNPRIDWQLTVRDAVHEADVILIHWASTQSSYPGVTSAQGGSGRGRILVKNPAGSPAFINTGFALSLNACHTLEVALDNVANTVTLSINGTLRVTTTRLTPNAARLDSFHVRQMANGQGTGGVNRLALDNFGLCLSGEALSWPDCNADCIDDLLAIAGGMNADCDSNSVPDDCEPDCNGNGVGDTCDITSGTSLDCDANGVPDECQPDCNADSTPNACDPDCASDGVSDVCELAAGTSLDCNGNAVPDGCDIAHGTSADLVGPGAMSDGVPDECQPDCNGNRILDETDIVTDTSEDCNGNAIPDECDLAAETSGDCAGDGTPDECQGDCNGNGLADSCDLASGTSQDCNINGAPDECDVGGASVRWRTYNGVPWDPSMRSEHGMAYDSARQRVVLFGGRLTPGGYDHVTWEWNGSAWLPRALTGPPGQIYHAMAYDEVRRVTVLFSGYQGSAARGETWEWNGDTWSLRATTGPSRRENHAMAYDAARRSVVLFGGGAGQAHYGDTWEWNGSTWTRRADSGPSPRRSHAMAYDETRRVVVLFGGRGGAPNYPRHNDTWEWNGSLWTLRSTAGPLPRAEHALAYDSGRGVTVLYGGEGSSAYGDTWEWDGSTWSLSVPWSEGPGSDYTHAMVYDRARRQVVMVPDRAAGTWNLGPQSRDCNGDMVPDECSGQGSTCITNPSADLCDNDCNDNGFRDACDLWAGTSQDCDSDDIPDECQDDCNGNGLRDSCDITAGTSEDCNENGTPDACDVASVRWRLGASAGPSDRNGAAMAYDSARHVVVLFGGFDGALLSGETFEWDTEAGTWSLRATTGPEARWKHAMAYDSRRRVVVMYGGHTLTSGDLLTWEWDGQVWTSHSVPGPGWRNRHAMAYDSARGVTVLFGTEFNVNNQTWEWNGSEWSLRSSDGPSARYATALAYDSTRHVVVMFGGIDAGYNGETWEWDGSAWSLRSSTGPAPRALHAMAYDSHRQLILLSGGTDEGGPGSGGTWEWNGSIWMQRPGTGPGGRSDHALAFDSVRRQAVLFGGAGEDDDTWLLGPVSPDCNQSGTPDACESLAPCAHIVGAVSRRTHGNGIGPADVSIHAGEYAELYGAASEPRGGGIVELRLAFDASPGAPGPADVTLEQRACGDSGDYIAYAGASSLSTLIEGDELVLGFSPALENARTYRLTLGPDISAAPGQSIEVRGLVGDVNSDGRVNGGDRSRVIGVWTGAGYSAAMDLDLNGATNASDRSAVIAAWTGPENCAP